MDRLLSIGDWRLAMPRFNGAEHHKDHLVFRVFNDFSQFRLKAGLLRRIEVTLEYRELEVVAVVRANFQGPAQAFGIGNVITNQVSGAHDPKVQSPKSRSAGGEGT